MLYKIGLSGILVLGVLSLAGCGGGVAEDSEPSSNSGTSTSGSSNSSGGASSSGVASSSSGGLSLDVGEDQSVFNGSPVDAEATEFYFSYDESASTASRDLSLYAIQNGGEVNPDWGRTYEFLNAESFQHLGPPEEQAPFSISMGLYKAEVGEVALGQSYGSDLYALGVNISGPVLTKESRPNVVLTLLVDVSGSMDEAYAKQTREDFYSMMEVTKHGLLQSLQSLKPGDVINLVTFEDDTRVILSDWSFSDDSSAFESAVNNMVARGGTDLYGGLEKAYSVAHDSFDGSKSNRVIIFTDAYVNKGIRYPSVIPDSLKVDEAEGILLSGIGIGSHFKDSFLNKLTDIGKGTYSAMITPNDAERIMTEGFMRFVDSAVSNVKFKLSYPQSLDQLESAAENISSDESEVSEIDFAYNSSQFFLEMFDGSVEASDVLTFTASFEFEGESQTIEVTKTVEQLMSVNVDELKSAILVTRLAKILANELSCEQVMSSGLYSQVSSAAIFLNYQAVISDFCASKG